MAWFRAWTFDEQRVREALLGGVLPEDVEVSTQARMDLVVKRLQELELWDFITGLPVVHGKENAYPSQQMLGAIALLELAEGNTRLAAAGKILQDATLIGALGFNVELFDRRKGEGVVSAGTLRNHLKKVPKGEGPKALRRQAQYMRQRKWLRGHIYAADGTKLEVGKGTSHEGAGEVWDGQEERWAYGYKLLTLQNLAENRSRCVAMDLKPINADEHQMLDDALAALGADMGLESLRQMIQLLILDRGYWGAEFLYRLGHHYKLKYLTLGKKNLELLQEAKAQRELRKAEYRSYRVKNKTTGLPSTIELCGLEGVPLNGYTADGKGMGDVNVVLAREWVETAKINGKTVEAHWDEWYYVTNQPLGKDWLAVYLQYEARWGIENEGFRTLKQAYHLDQLPGRSLAAIEARTALVLMLYNAMNILDMKYPEDGKEALRQRRKRGHASHLNEQAVIVYIPAGYVASFRPPEYHRLTVEGARRRAQLEAVDAVEAIGRKFDLTPEVRAELRKTFRT